MTQLERLLQRVNCHGDLNDPQTPRPLVSLEEFFDGNDDWGSIGYNFYPQPAPQEFYAVFKSIRERTDVVDVLVEIKDQVEPTDWPSTDTIWVITSLSPALIQQLLGETFQGDDVLEGWPQDHPIEFYEVPLGMKPLGIWYD
jgi:hypothetical protein